ncbi:hypothetical protein DF185_19780 [Marinifilum breve]|uniref:Uncharacterized protein n=2 Tax=Marinifilum breve TaxID=2184082 RepID=A0A2V3ZT59_9BACT|nr:hypothetical protein DF185_19780 [Marinifilum breve]
MVELLLNVIENEADRLTPGNVGHYKNSIKCTANKVKAMLVQKPKYKCYRCKDTGVIDSEEFHGHTEGIVHENKQCSCQQKE